MAKTPAKRKPPKAVAKSRQYDLFAQFFGDTDDLSNTIELWDAIPKYAVSARRQVSMRDSNKRLPVHEYSFEYRRAGQPGSVRCRIEVQPASIKVDGEFRDFYPSADEELVEEVIRKIFANQQYGLHDAPVLESWVRFSPSMIRKELDLRDKTRSYGEIRRSIDILANTIIRLYVEDDPDPIYTNPVLSDLTQVRRADYLEDPSSMWVARLPALVSKSVNELTYRQFNYGKLMSLHSQLARWLHKRLSHRYTNASVFQDYEILFSSLKRDSGFLEANRITKNRQALEAALDELKAADVILDWQAEERRGERNRIDDILYRIKAHPHFISDVKAANKRSSEAKAEVGFKPARK